MEYRLELLPASDLQKVYDIELACFPSEEAETFAAIQQRHQAAPELFYGAYTPNSADLAGFICSSRFNSLPYTKAMMNEHSPRGPYAAIHSVCVAPAYRRKGLGLRMLEDYIKVLRSTTGIRGVRLITHSHLQAMYERAGFTLVGESEVVHGPDKWWEMKLDFAQTESTAAPDTALEADPVDMRNPGKRIASFAAGLDDLVDRDTGSNRADLFCPRPECRCILLRAGAGKLVTAQKSDFELPALPRPLASPPPARTPHSSTFWSVQSPLAFENIGFSRNAAPPTNNEKGSASADHSSVTNATIKYLTCADCDHGPLGWHDTEGRDLGLEVEEENEGRAAGVRRGREFLLAVDRVRYRLKSD